MRTRDRSSCRWNFATEVLVRLARGSVDLNLEELGRAFAVHSVGAPKIVLSAECWRRDRCVQWLVEIIGSGS